MTSLLKDAPETLPNSWDDTVHGFKVALTPTDDFGFPMGKRGASFPAPKDSREYAKFAKEVGALVEKTIREILKVADDPA